LRGSPDVPGDKSISHRALILGAMAQGQTRIEGLLESADVRATLEAVSAFGAEVSQDDGIWEVSGTIWRSPSGEIDCGNSGTSARLLVGASAGYGLTAGFTGDDSLRRRPMDHVAEPLRDMGARIGGGPTLPMEVKGGGLKGINFVNETASAQVKSAILLAGLHADGEVEIFEPSRSRDHSERMLRAFGAEVDAQPAGEGARVRLSGRRKLEGTKITVPADPSSAAFPLVASLLTERSSIRLRGVLANPLRFGLFETLIEMGADLGVEGRRAVSGEEVADLVARSSNLGSIDVPATRAPSMIDEYPILAVAAACAAGVSVLRGLSELRVKESDRLAAIVEGLRACGVDAWIEEEALFVQGCGGPPPGGARVRSFGDHRIAMAFLVLGLCARQAVEIDQADMIDTSFPAFAELMHGLGAKVERI
jgi:3-phosphoshikimate 1-carboxyvinyltransferase